MVPHWRPESSNSKTKLTTGLEIQRGAKAEAVACFQGRQWIFKQKVLNEVETHTLFLERCLSAFLCPSSQPLLPPSNSKRPPRLLQCRKPNQERTVSEPTSVGGVYVWCGLWMLARKTAALRTGSYWGIGPSCWLWVFNKRIHSCGWTFAEAEPFCPREVWWNRWTG